MHNQAPPPIPRARSRRRIWQLRTLALGTALTFSLLLAEGLLQIAPGLLPTSFRKNYPPNGVEFFDRGVLERTPLNAVPLPYGVQPYDGPPPHDIGDFGVATPANTERDRREVPRLVLPADSDGLPNVSRPTNPDLVLVGDSFTVFAAQQEPSGLQNALETEHGASCLNVGISGIGPDQELWLLKNVGLPSKPRAVVWFLFGGNDFMDAFWLRWSLAAGKQTYADLYKDQRAPRLLLPSLIANWISPKVQESLGTDVSPLAPLTLRDHADSDMWFAPDVLRILSLPPKLLTEQSTWVGITEVLQEAHTAVESAGAKLLIVFVPSKEQVYLPQIHPDAALLHAYTKASTFIAVPMADDPDQLLADLLANAGTFEAAVRAFCESSGIQFWSATPALTKASLTGKPLYYRTDTHWRAEGQHVIVPGLREQLTQLGITKQ
jgi:hypothetical protein